MMKKILILTLIFATTDLWAGGYRVSLQGVRQAALGAQGSTLTRDASVAFYNPAGLAFVDSKLSIAAGAFGVFSNVKYQNRTTLEKAETDNPVGTPFYLAASYKPTEKLAVGLSVSTPFGNTISWGDQWSGRYLIDEISLASFFFQPTVAYKFTDWLSVGGGFIYALGEVTLDKNVPAGSNDIHLAIEESDASGTGFNLGAMVKPHEKVTVGLAYRSKVTMKAEDGDVKWKDVPGIFSTSLPFTTTSFDAELPLVSEFIFGVNFQATDRLMIAGEISANGWKDYEKLTLTFTNDDGDTYISSEKRNYKNTINYSLGAEYMATKELALRLGYKFDKTPSPDNYFSPETPTVDYHAFNIGAGYNFGKFYVDAFGEFLVGEERTFSNVDTGFSGDINNRTFIAGVGVTYNVGNVFKKTKEEDN